MLINCNIEPLNSDYTFYFTAIPRYFNEVFDVDMFPNQKIYCRIYIATLSIMIRCSTLFIVAMTFERFYSIRPHKVASFNTTKRAKIAISCMVIFCILYRIPYFFITIMLLGYAPFTTQLYTFNFTTTCHL